MSMRRIALLIAFGICAVWTGSVLAQTQTPSLFDSMGQRYSVDATLLRAVAYVESGSYPWTIDLNGEPFFFSSKDEALEFARDTRTRPWLLVATRASDGMVVRYLFSSRRQAETFQHHHGGLVHGRLRNVDVKNMDVGLMQINWQIHHSNIPSLSRLLDPEYNIAYGAWLLSKLIHKYHNPWVAVGYYHAVSREARLTYSREVRHYYDSLVAQEETGENGVSYADLDPHS